MLVPTPNIQTRQFDGHDIRAVDIDGRSWLVAIDLADPLDVDRRVIRRRIDDLEPSDKGGYTVSTPGGPQQVVVVSESGAYQLIVQSRKPAAARLRKFICDIYVSWGRGEFWSS